MATRARFPKVLANAKGLPAAAADTVTVEQLVEIAYTVLRRHPEALVDWEATFLAMAKK